MVDVVVGIDVSKRRLDVLIGSKGKHFAVANDAAGLAELVGKLQGCAVKLCVLEATGGLEQAAVVHLQEQGIAVSVVNPRQARDFAKATGRLSKTDAIDARALALFGETVELRIASPVDPRRVTLSEVGARREQLSQMRTAEYNRLNSCQDSELRTEVEEHIELLDERIARLDSRRDKMINEDKDLKAKAALLRTIPGVGPVTTATVLADLPELETLTRKELASLVGVAPHCRDSGQSRGQRVIWGGREHVRSKLYMAALVGTRCNPVIKEFYEHLQANGKKRKVALVACIHKLLHIMRAVVTSKQPWDPLYSKHIDEIRIDPTAA